MENLKLAVPETLRRRIAESSPDDLPSTSSALLRFFDHLPLFHQVIYSTLVSFSFRTPVFAQCIYVLGLNCSVSWFIMPNLNVFLTLKLSLWGILWLRGSLCLRKKIVELNTVGHAKYAFLWVLYFRFLGSWQTQKGVCVARTRWLLWNQSLRATTASPGEIFLRRWNFTPRSCPFLLLYFLFFGVWVKIVFDQEIYSLYMLVV